MKLLSEFIKDLQALQEQHGDLPVVTVDSDALAESIPEDDAQSSFVENGAWDEEKKQNCDCILII